MLHAGWRRAARSGALRYDAGRAESARPGRYRYHYLPDRQGRPTTHGEGRAAGGLFRPHVPCPFDGGRLEGERELARAVCGGREYHLTYNRFPVTADHFLAIRPEGAPASSLPQHLHGPEEIEDICACLRAVGPRFRGYFNSSPGVDGSRSGSSIHHWHFHFLAYPFGRTPMEETAGGSRDGRGGGAAAPSPVAGHPGVTESRLVDWPASHRSLASGDAAALGRAVWEAVTPVHRRDAAYNVEVRALEDGSMRAMLFPRRPAAAAEVEGVGSLPADFGGWEVTGDLVIPTLDLYRWHLSSPEEADRLTERRLAETTGPAGD